MLVRKILETTLTAGATSVTFTDSDIPNSLIRTYCTDSDLYPVSVSMTGTTITITYEAQSTNKGIALEIVKSGLQVIDNLTSEDAENALSAKQGKVLKDAIDGMTAPALTELSDISFTDLTDGDMIVYDGTDQVFVNQAQPSIPSDITDLDDVSISSIANGQVLTWDNSIQKFINADPAGGNIQLTTKTWTATTSSASGTQLTESASLTAGIYVIDVHLPYSSSTSNSFFALVINNTMVDTTVAYLPVSSSRTTYILQLSETSTLYFATASGTSVSWDNAYLSRGGMNILKLT